MKLIVITAFAQAAVALANLMYVRIQTLNGAKGSGALALMAIALSVSSGIMIAFISFSSVDSAGSGAASDKKVKQD